MPVFVLGEVARVSKKHAIYVKIEIYNEERENNPMLCFSSTDPNVCQIEDKYQKAELIK